MATLTLKVMFHQANSSLSTSVSVNLHYLLLAAVEERELVDTVISKELEQFISNPL